MRRRRVLPALVLILLAVVTYTVVVFSDIRLTAAKDNYGPTQQPLPLTGPNLVPEITKHGPDAKQFEPTVHPIKVLVSQAETELEAIQARQSKTLAEAVTEYRRRYGIPPPPNFDKWFAFAKANKVQLVDEFDTIHDMLKPFWGLRPKTIRDRVKEALGYDNVLMAISIRDGHVAQSAGGPVWQREATIGMMSKFVKHLANMDLAFNVHDEPRVVVPHDDLARLVDTAVRVNMPKAAQQAKKLTNAFTRPHPDAIEEVRTTRFNEFAHQRTWSHSRLSCPIGSPARMLEDGDAQDDRSRYGLGDLGFVYNVTAMSDICLSPSLAGVHGFYDGPNAYNVALDLVPVFSQSKPSSYSDILYPSPWYWHDKVPYDESKDLDWDKKEGKLYWRGSTTGGFSRNGGWRRHHRQHVVSKLNSPTQAKIYAPLDRQRHTAAAPERKDDQAKALRRDDTTENETNVDAPTPLLFEVVEVPRGDYKDVIDVSFSHVGQCDAGDCDAQREFFPIRDQTDAQDAWRYKYLLDMDGNAFSGRFYAFLKSRSLTFKLAIFREWHADWLRPWAHYVPLSLQGDDWLEAVRYLGARAATEKHDGGLWLGETEARAGEALGARIASQSRDWARKVLRNEDLEAWFFRLLLE